MNSKQKYFYALYYYFGWGACLIFAKYKYDLYALLLPLPIYLELKLKNNISNKTLGLCLLFASIGIFFDSLMLHFGFTEYPLNEHKTFIPVWLISIWFLFIGIQPSLSTVFKNHQILGVVLAILLGPLSYYSGQSLNLFYFKSVNAIVIYSFFWGMFFLAGINFINFKKK